MYEDIFPNRNKRKNKGDVLCGLGATDSPRWHLLPCAAKPAAKQTPITNEPHLQFLLEFEANIPIEKTPTHSPDSLPIATNRSLASSRFVAFLFSSNPWLTLLLVAIAACLSRSVVPAGRDVDSFI